jgi:hypothetical protein
MIRVESNREHGRDQHTGRHLQLHGAADGTRRDRPCPAESVDPRPVVVQDIDLAG